MLLQEDNPSVQDVRSARETTLRMLGLSQQGYRLDDQPPEGPFPDVPGMERPGPYDVFLGHRRRNVRGYIDVLPEWTPEVEPVRPVEGVQDYRRRSVSVAAGREAGSSSRTAGEGRTHARERSGRPSVHMSTPEATLPAFGGDDTWESSRHSISFTPPTRIGDYYGRASTSRGAQQEPWPGTSSSDYYSGFPSMEAPLPDTQPEAGPSRPRRGSRQRRGRGCGTGGQLGPHHH